MLDVNMMGNIKRAKQIQMDSDSVRKIVKTITLPYSVVQSCVNNNISIIQHTHISFEKDV